MNHSPRRRENASVSSWSDGELVPFSYIDHEARDSEFHVHAFHAFPEELTLLKTQSIFEIVPQTRERYR